MKTLAERITALKEAEAKAWDKYREAILTEMNALLKRMGQPLVEKANDIGFNSEFDKEVSQANLMCQLSPKVKAYMTVKQYTYIQALREKWGEASVKLTEVKIALEGK